MKYLILPSVLLLCGCGPQNYDECLLKESKGLEASLIPTVRKVCESRFPYEKQIFIDQSDYSFSWRNRGDTVNGAAIEFEIIKEHPNYIITKVITSLYIEKCDNVTDFSKPDTYATLRFRHNPLETVSLPEKDGYYSCLRIEKIFGIWRQ
ncbi:hypothetical protein I6M32_06440 [Shewanella algae]|uniref:hypothetical protein n=1 Tax=Shewanella algae TaxID=38313 RepID=UPI001AADD1C3|nr:hypothetical protein [Shewanella algae]MBO2611208.1 hypothetical protein [Shewanella algae]